MVISLKHKWLIYALSVLVAAIAAHESMRLLFLLVVVVVFCIYKQFSIFHCICVIVIGIVCYLHFSFQLNHIHQPLELPSTLTWTDEYKINGAKLRGFMKDELGRKIYVTYEFKNEVEKSSFLSIPLVGMQFEVMGTLNQPDPPAHKFGFNMNNYLKSKGAVGVLEITDWTYLNTTSSIIQKLSSQRYFLIQHIEKTFPTSLVAEAQSLLIGFQENVELEMTRAYQKLGITHLFAISGLHIAILSLIVYEGLLRMKTRRELATFLLILILPIYGVLAGGAPSVWRAVIVAEIILLTRLFKKIAMDDALAISFIFFVLIEPWSIYQIGFQLSYLATLSLIYSGGILSRNKSWLVQSFLITFVCQLLVYPLLLFHFYELSISSLVANIIFVPLFSFVILPINIVLLIASFLPGQIDSFLFLIYEPLREILAQLILWTQTIPNQMWIPGKPATVLILVAYISVFYFFYLFDKGAKYWMYFLVLFIPIILLQVHNKWFEDFKISFISVGQGDSILIELPYSSEIYLIDTGGVLRFEGEEWKNTNEPYEVGRQIVVPYLKGKGIHRIDKLIITHADSDHVEGAEEIVKEIEVKEIHITPNSYEKEVMKELVMEAINRGIPIIEQMLGDYWVWNEYIFQYLWPNDTKYDGNNDSLVLYVSNGQFEALLTGDLEEAGEKEILKLYPQLENVTILKAGHHGSKTSSSELFLQKLMPKLTIFSSGKDNRYGHPHKEVIERFESFNLKMLKTADSGTIEITVDQKEMEIFTSN